MPQSTSSTRMIAMGSEALTDGFAMIGFETFPDASVDQLEELLADLLRQRVRAWIVIEPYLSHEPGKLLQQVRSEGGYILVTEIPPLNAPDDHRLAVEDLVTSVLGERALES
jgi:vacuolar-type H+-ATPase subunit F/Vma7